ncbi:MAG: tetratricopeptide repeat protein [bacterium]
MNTKLINNKYLFDVIKSILIIIPVMFFLGSSNSLYAQNIDSLEKIVNTTKSSNKPSIYNELSKAYQNNAIDKSIQYSQFALDYSQKTGDKKNESMAYFNLGICNVLQHKVLDAKQYFQLSLDIRKKIGNDTLIAASYNALGNVTRLSGDNKLALDYHLKALALRKKIGDKLLIAGSINNIGIIYKTGGNNKRALEYYLQALKYGEELKDSTLILHALINIGNVYSDLKNHNKSLKYYYQVLDIAEKTNNQAKIASIYNSIGTAYNYLNNVQKAINCFHKSYQIGKKIGDVNSQCYSLNNLGVAYSNLKNYDMALKYYLLSAELSPENNDIYSDATSMNNIGSIYCFKKQYSKALPYLLKSLKLNQKMENVLTLRENYVLLAAVYEGLKDYHQAYNYHKKYSELDDSISSEFMNKQIGDLQVKFETAQKEKEIAILKSEKANVSNVRNYLYALTMLGLLLIIVLTILFLNKLKANKILAQKSELISTQRDQLSSTLEDLNRTHQANEQYLGIITEELSTAFDYVSSLIPDEIKEGKIRTQWMLKPSSNLGGDIFGYHWLDKNKLSIYLLDVSGHGVIGSLHAISILNSIKYQTLANTNYEKPDEVLNSLNKTYQMLDHNKLFFTIWYGVYNIETRELNYATAGHPPAILVEKSGDSQFIGTRNYVIGGTKIIQYTSDSIVIQPFSKMYIFSDGVYEIRDASGNIWSIEGLKQFIQSHEFDEGKDLDFLYKYAMNYRGKNYLEDDFSILKFIFE